MPNDKLSDAVDLKTPAIRERGEHTPGPWTVESNYGMCLVWARNMRVCDLRGWGYLTGSGGLGLPPKEAAEIQDANARLIAAAPDLLAACNEALNALIGCAVPAGGCDDKKHLLEAQASLRAAIARAEGKDA